MIHFWNKYTVIIVLSFLLLGCGGYSEVLRNDDYVQKRAYADAAYEKGEFDKAIALFEQVYQRNPRGEEGEDAYFKMGMSYYNVNDYSMANYMLSNFPVKFPYSDRAEEAFFYSVVAASNLSPSFELDQTDTEAAIDEIQNFVDTYPDSEYMERCNEILNTLYGKIEKKEFEAINLYSRMENYRAASSSAEEFISARPMSTYREKVYYILVKNSYHLAINSIDSKKRERVDKAIERYLNFVAEFPNTTYLREVKSYYDKLSKIV